MNVFNKISYSRPDRNNYLTVDLTQVSNPRNHRVIENWLDTGSQYRFRKTNKYNFYDFKSKNNYKEPID